MRERVLSSNRKASYLYSIKEKLEAGVVLTGEEVKATRKGKMNINNAFIGERNGELYVMQSNIGRYDKSTNTEHEETRHRKLLLHKKQINKIIGNIKNPGYSAVILKAYANSRNKIKLEIAIVRGKTEIDKRNTIKKREWEREKATLLKINKR